jgi:hypothetical protein
MLLGSTSKGRTVSGVQKVPNAIWAGMEIFSRYRVMQNELKKRDWEAIR